ncbi:unnamed protein product [Darwinula stevensoni]|uniref:Uncharacterized protein n=1 Tax=Darwinula stevensoni TaxID=69355 RepID=A0A7R9AA73_9CRUS|nr:unnamed protein product [Darwinula stevensoni]CAG0898094.1 unnamed protein product [Darwinula stevensoni]
MPVLHSCWSPWLHYKDLNLATNAVAWYTMAISVVGLTYAIYAMMGGHSADFFSPLFETDRYSSMIGAGVFMILFCLVFFIFSILMIKGVKVRIRGYLLPWLIQSIIYILSLLAFGLWILWSYYTHLPSVLAFLLIWLIAAFHIYCTLCAYSTYQVVRKEQATEIMVFHPF